VNAVVFGVDQAEQALLTDRLPALMAEHARPPLGPTSIDL
jgi:hypothetical protein